MPGPAAPGYIAPAPGAPIGAFMAKWNPLSPAELDALAASALAAGLAAAAGSYSTYGLAAATAASRPTPCVLYGGEGIWQVGLLQPDGATFAPQYSTVLGGYARFLAYGWETPQNGLNEIRQRLGVTLAQPAAEQVG